MKLHTQMSADRAPRLVSTVRRGAGLVLACWAIGCASNKNATTNTLNGVQEYLRENDWSTPSVPRENNGPGDILSKAGEKFSFVGRIDACGSSTIAIRKGQAALPATKVEFSATATVAAKVLNLAKFDVTGLRFSSIDVQPTKLEIWTMSSGEIRKFIAENGETFKQRCLVDFKSAGNVLVNEAIVATQLTIRLRDQSGTTINIQSAKDLAEYVEFGGRASIAAREDGTLEISNINLIFAFHSMPVQQFIETN